LFFALNIFLKMYFIISSLVFLNFDIFVANILVTWSSRSLKFTEVLLMECSTSYEISFFNAIKKSSLTSWLSNMNIINYLENSDNIVSLYDRISFYLLIKSMFSWEEYFYGK
jgi:hypothetical protein